MIRPVLDSAPINQLLVTGGVLFFLQAAATMVFGIDFKNLGIRLRLVQACDMSFSLCAHHHVRRRARRACWQL